MMEDIFTSRDMDALLAADGLAGLDADTAFKAIRSAVDNPVGENGRAVATEDYDADAAVDFLAKEFVRSNLPSAVSVAESVARSQKAERRASTDEAVMSVTGVSPSELGMAQLARDAGDPSDLLRIYSKYIARC